MILGLHLTSLVFVVSAAVKIVGKLESSSTSSAISPLPAETGIVSDPVFVVSPAVEIM